MTTPSANDILTARMAGRSDTDHLVELDRLSRHLEEELRKTRIERDLAIAHDSQSYPTAAAYEAVCATLLKERVEVVRLEGILREIMVLAAQRLLPVTAKIHDLTLAARNQ